MNRITQESSISTDPEIAAYLNRNPKPLFESFVDSRCRASIRRHENGVDRRPGTIKVAGSAR